MVRIRSGIANACSRGSTGDPDVAAAEELLVDGRLDRPDELGRHPLELEVHPAAAGLHVAAGHERPVVAPDDAAQGVQRGVRAHQPEAAVPVEVGGEDRRAGRRRLGARLQLVPDLVAGLLRGHDLPGPPVGRPDLAAVGRLAAAARVEDGAVEEDEGALPLGRGGSTARTLAGTLRA